MESGGEKLSTTALARKLSIPVQQLFAILKDYGWIQRVQDSWKLTQKGEFEGGSYQTSRRYGAYIVWPEQLSQHPLLQAIESNQRITAASMCRYYPHFHARQINRALAELGLQHHTKMGWELTDWGRSLGGLQEESKNSGAFYVTWPHELVDHPVVHRELSRHSGQIITPVSADDPEQDLFADASGAIEVCQGVDGHSLQSSLQTSVCDWLYLAQLAHAIRRSLPTEELIYADFYVPVGNVYIDCWEPDVPADQLSEKLRKRELYRELQLRNLEINAGDADKLDEVLGRGLLSFGIRY
jgi:hypothetical protein